MNRRRFLATLSAGCTAVAGCASVGPGATGGDQASPELTPTGGTGAAPTTNRPAGADGTARSTTPSELASRGHPTTICAQEINPDFTIRAIVDPRFADSWSAFDIPETYDYGGAGLSPDATVVGVERNEETRAYPLSVVAAHEIINDRFDGPLLVTYCPLCESGLVADRVVDGAATVFGVSGALWKVDGSEFNLVMYDRATRSYWSQILATAICGPMTGTELRQRPFSMTTWGAWRSDHPGTRVLLPPPHSEVM